MVKKIIITRKVQKYFLKIRDKIHFILSHMSLGSKFALFALSICFISLFFSWFEVSDIQIPIWVTNNSFSSLIWNIWYFYLFLILFNSFHILSIKKRKQLRNISGMYISNTQLSCITSLIIFFSCIHIYLLIWGLNFFSSNITHWNGLILCITGALLLGISVYFLKNEEKKSLSGTYIHHSKDSFPMQKDQQSETNMKLPV
jgi:hypothetical protein